MAIDAGWLDDEIVVSLTGKDVTARCIDYTVKCSVFQQPSACVLRLGEQFDLREFMTAHKAGDPFELRMQRFTGNEVPDLDVPLQTGRIDAVDPTDSDETTIEIRGRDNIAALFDSYFMQEDSYTEATFYDLTAKQMKAVGFEAADWLVTGETGRQKAITNAGGGMKRSSAPVRTDTTTVEHLDYAWVWTQLSGGGAAKSNICSVPNAPAGSDKDGKSALVETVSGGQAKQEIKTLKATIGTQRLGWLKEQYKRVGLFLWCIPNGQFLLSAPNAEQEPAFRIQRLLSGAAGTSNIIGGGPKNDTVQRYSHTRVYGRAGGGKGGRGRIVGEYIDQAMIDGGLIKQISYEETDIKTTKAADNLARRYAADARRSARSMQYTVPGHSAPSLVQPGKRFPFYVNTMVHVVDEKCGIDGVYYLGDVEFKRQPHTTTTLTLYWPEDLVFAEE